MTSPIPPLVAYYRVSTERQGQSGLGLHAQRSAVSAYAAGKDLLGEFVEVKSGRKDNRPLAAAKARGTRLGNPRPNLVKAGVAASDMAASFRATIAPMITALSNEGNSLRAIARELNIRGIGSARGRSWHAASVRACLHNQYVAEGNAPGTATAIIVV